MIFYIANIILALIGLYLSFRIYREKRHAKNGAPMTCPIGGSCEHVLFSKYSKILGVDIEFFGFIYYAFLVLGYSVLLQTASSISLSLGFGLLEFILLIASIAGFAFSLYLTFVQGFFIKNWCGWCLSSSAVSTIIFIISSFSFAASMSGGIDISDILISYIQPILILRVIAISIGISSVTVSTIMTIKFLKDLRIDEQEDKKINIVNQITWVSVLLLIIVNVAIFLISPSIYSDSPDWVTQLLILAVIVFSTAIQDLHIQPNLVGIRLDLSAIHVMRIFWLRQNAFSIAAITTVSWYMMAFVSLFNNNATDAGIGKVEINNDAVVMISYYISIVIVAVIVSQITTFLIDKGRVMLNKKETSIQ